MMCRPGWRRSDKRPATALRRACWRDRQCWQDLDQGNAGHHSGNSGKNPCQRGQLQQPLGRAADTGADAADTEFAVIEIGMNHPGEIAPLAPPGPPACGLVTTVAAVHLEAFESVAGHRPRKGRDFRGAEPGGAAIVNADIDHAEILRQTRRTTVPGSLSLAEGCRLQTDGCDCRAGLGAGEGPAVR